MQKMEARETTKHSPVIQRFLSYGPIHDQDQQLDSNLGFSEGRQQRSMLKTHLGPLHNLTYWVWGHMKQKWKGRLDSQQQFRALHRGDFGKPWLGLSSGITIEVKNNTHSTTCFQCLQPSVSSGPRSFHALEAALAPLYHPLFSTMEFSMFCLAAWVPAGQSTCQLTFHWFYDSMGEIKRSPQKAMAKSLLLSTVQDFAYRTRHCFLYHQLQIQTNPVGFSGINPDSHWYNPWYQVAHAEQQSFWYTMCRQKFEGLVSSPSTKYRRYNRVESIIALCPVI